MPDHEILGVHAEITDTVRKWNPGSDLTSEPDEVTTASYTAEMFGAGARYHARSERRRKMLGLALVVGVALASALSGGLHREPMAYGGLSTIGAAAMADLLIGGGTYTAFNNANAYLGVGDSATAFAVGQTDLQAASNKLRKGMDSTYPTRSSNVLTFRSTYSSAEANFAWAENGVFNHASAGQLLTRKVVSLGTKVSGATWEFTKTVTITAA
jgi:hypothetical protein